MLLLTGVCQNTAYRICRVFFLCRVEEWCGIEYGDICAVICPKGRTAHPHCLAKYFNLGADCDINSLQLPNAPHPTLFFERFDLISYSYSKRLIKGTEGWY